MKSGMILLGGAVFTIFNLLPLPWRLRVQWMKFLYLVTAKGTQLFPSLLTWTKQQNMVYKMGKQEGEGYESLVQLERILEYLEQARIPIREIKQAVQQAEREAVPHEQIAAFIARVILDPLTAERVLRESLQGARY
jgi:hypothetical protein